MPPWPCAFRTSRAFIHPCVDPSPSVDAETELIGCASPYKIAMWRRVPQAKGGITGAKKDMCVPVLPRDGRVLSV